MARLAEVVGKAISGEWGQDDKAGTGIPVLRTTNFTNEGVINFSEVVTRTITKKDLSQKYLKPGDIITFWLNKDNRIPKFASVYVTCVLLSTLKREILGQNITPLTIIQVLITDYFEKSDLVNESRCYVEGKMKELFPDEQII